MRVIYVSGPLWSASWWGRLRNIARASRASWRLWRGGCAVICPHTNSGLFSLLGDWTERRARWLSGDLAMLARCDGLYLLRGWHRSSGALTEFQKARAVGLAVEFEAGAVVPVELANGSFFMSERCVQDAAEAAMGAS